MKKKLIGVAVIAAIAVTAGWNFNQSKNEMELNDLALANVEALATNETGNRYQTMGYCSPSDLNYMCTSRQTAETCRRPCN